MAKTSFRWNWDKLFTGLIILLTLLLSGCGHTPRKDGPPNYYVDETRIPNAVPKAEPLAKLGNMRSYKVFGKRYYTLRSSKNFVQVGVASWYGTQFHSRSTSSGEPYDMLAMTAAHKTLPLPTYVEVTNLRNKRKIIVKVNDRGPFASNRIIDLSYVAAKKLGMMGRGTTMVRIKAINPYSYGKRLGTTINAKLNKNKAQKATGAKSIYLQVGVFTKKKYAAQLKSSLTPAIDHPVSITRSRSGARLYRVRIGPIKDNATVDQLKLKLRDLGYSADRIV